MRVSAIITTFNRAHFLEKAIQSVLAQTFTDFELIVLDNSSSDDTAEVVAGFKDPRIVYVKHPPLGISGARNLGVKTARGEFVGFLDDDDEWLPNKLELQVKKFDASPSSVALVYGGFERVTSEGEIYSTFTPRLRGNVLERYVCGHDPLTGSASNPLIRKSAFDVVGRYDENIRTSEDWECYIRLARKFEFEFVPEPLLQIRKHGGARLGDKLEEAARTELIMCEKLKDFFATRKKCYSYYLQTVGGKYCRVGKMEEGRTYLRQALALAPSNYIARVQLVVSFLGKRAYSFLHRTYQALRKKE